MRMKFLALLPLTALLLTGCNDSLDAIDPGYVKNVKNKTEQPLPDRIVAEMKAKGVAFSMEPTTIRPGVRICFLRAPENVSIELLERSAA